MCEAVTFLLDNIYIRFGTNLFRQIVGIPIGANNAPLVADLFLFCYESSCGHGTKAVIQNHKSINE